MEKNSLREVMEISVMVSKKDIINIQNKLIQLDEVNAENIKIKENIQKRVDQLEELFNDNQRMKSIEKRVDQLEDIYNGEYKNETVKIRQNQQRLDYLEQTTEDINRRINILERQSNAAGVALEHEFCFLDKLTNSQCGEDAILAYIVSVLGIPLEKCTYLDLGANHPVEGSNTNFFYRRGANGVLVEANPQLIPDLKAKRSGDIILNRCVDTSLGSKIKFYILSDDGLSTPNEEQAKEIQQKNPDVRILDTIEIESITVNDIFDEYFTDKELVIMSVDIEGKDYEVLKSIDFQKCRPLLIVVEMIEYAKDKLSFTKDNEILNYMMENDYEEYAFTGVNSIFIDRKSKYLK